MLRLICPHGLKTVVSEMWTIRIVFFRTMTKLSANDLPLPRVFRPGVKVVAIGIVYSQSKDVG